MTKVGIDLGTTYSLVSIMRAGRPEIVPNVLGEELTPSAVSVDERGEVLTGRAARARAVTHPDLTAVAFKRDMGTARRYSLGSRSFSPEELSALLLATLKRDAEEVLGETIEEAVVTVPAYFGEAARRATRVACELAELRVERIINEPTAAALAYGLHQRDKELRAVVLDLGGGTFDVTVLEIMEGVIEIQASAGDTRLGGEDFLDVIVGWVADRVVERHGFDPRVSAGDRARLREACERAKHRLSTDDAARIALPALGARRQDVEIELRLDDVEPAFEPLLARMTTPIRRALSDAAVDPKQIDEVLLVGGATRMPSVAALAARLFGRLPSRALPPDEAVALGAAVQMALKAGNEAVEDMVVTDVAPFTLGIAVSQSIGMHDVGGLFAPILERGTVLPASREREFSTMADGQRMIAVEVYQGEHSLCKDNEKLGTYQVKGIPAGPAGKETISVRFSYDMNGLLEVDTTITSTGKTASMTLDRSKNRLTEEQVAEAKKRLKGLKFHPRDALPNTTALSRAEVLHAELTGVEREILRDAMNHFRAALELQDAKQISFAREMLLARIADLGHGR
ncbi:MAG: Hsp70 family protein [Myxococcales bacterium]|nr:Hsp70 family protein [Myxococcales bacterium]MCB9580456.1 Hsp70 family protein [Polyangiaceae bacterium]